MPGSGKSVVAKEAANGSASATSPPGDFMRDMAAERGMSILELSRVAETDPSIDAEIDARTVSLGATGESFVIDSRMAWHFIPDSVKVFLGVRTDVAAARIYASMRETERENVDLAATTAALRGTDPFRGRPLSPLLRHRLSGYRPVRHRHRHLARYRWRTS